MPGLMRMVIPGITAGIISGLVISGRDIMVAATWATIADPLRAVQDAALVMSAYALLGALAGIVAALLITLLVSAASVTWRPQGRWRLTLGAVAGGIVLLSHHAGGGWSSLAAQILLLNLLVLGLLWNREEDSPVIRPSLVGAAAGAFLATVVFFGAGSLINDLATAVMRGVGYVLAMGLAGLLGWGGFVAVHRLVEALDARIGTRSAVTLVLGASFVLMAVFAGAALIRPSLFDRLLVQLPEASAHNDARPNVILISVDTLRGDWVGYAGGPVHTPNIDALADRSYVFERAYTVAPWTRPSFAAFFSGLYPYEMGIARIRGYDAIGADAFPYRWREDRPMLAEVLRDNGYATAAVLTNGHLTEEAAADQGFDFFYNIVFSDVSGGLTHLARHALAIPEESSLDRERADRVTNTAIEVIQRKSGPLLLWLHYVDPHWPYDPPTIPPEQRVGGDPDPVIRGAKAQTGDARQRYIDAYSAEVAYFDDWLQPVIEALRSAGLWDNAIVIFFSDHGEEFWEHGGWAHGQSLYNEQMHVPLTIRMPGQTEGRRISQPVSLLDVMPTVLELCTVDSVPDGLRGRSLTPVLGPEEGDLGEFRVFMQGCSDRGIRKALMTERYKLIYDLYHDSFSLYDLQEDPWELHNIHGTALAPDTQQWEQDLLEFTETSLAAMDEVHGSGREEVSGAIRGWLRELGYIQ